MHRILSLLLAAALLLACTPVLAQHPVITASGQVDETQAVDILVDYLCIILRCGEEEVRGRWHYTAAYAPEGDSLDIHEGPVWDLEAGLPGGGEGIAFAHIYVDARCGLILEWCENPGCDLIGPEGWGEMCPIPRKDQMQPSEAVARAAGLLEEALAGVPGTVSLAMWPDYCLSGHADGSGRFWYHVELAAEFSTGYYSPFTWHVWLDANTGEVVWQSDPKRFAERCAWLFTGWSYEAVCEHRQAECESLWGSRDTWDYRQRAEFEEICCGSWYWPEPHYGLPGEDECTYEEASAAAVAWLTEQDADSGPWYVAASAFYVDYENRRHELLALGITEPEHLWALWLVKAGIQGPQVLVYVDPATGEITDGPVG